MTAIKIENLCKNYGKTAAVRGLSLFVEEGELYALLGVNGAGKSTAIRMMCCLTSPDSGEGKIGGYSITGEADRVKEIIGISPQETAVAPNLTVEENLRLMCGIYGYDRGKTEETTASLTARFRLEDVLHKRAGKLSGGYMRRLSIAMALVGDPRILFLDEPTLGLDVISRSELWDTIRELNSRRTVVLTTHYMEEAEALSDRIGMMKSGCLIAEGTAAELKVRTGCDRLEDAFIALMKAEEGTE